jgi:hypothetical protein
MRFLFVFLFTLFNKCVGQNTASNAIVLTYIEQNLATCGVLKNSDGFVYVDVKDEYILKLITLIKEHGFEPPPYFGEPGLVGAHISVIYPGEMKKDEVEKIQEYGDIIYFTPKSCQIVHPKKWKEVDQVYLLVVEAPKLDRIREKYGLPKNLHDFHITIAVKPKLAKSA